MRVLYAALRYDYGKPEQGYSFEHYNFFDSLRRLGHEVLYFDYTSLMAEFGRDGMNRRLLEVARAEQPDVLFCVLFGDELDRDVMRRISDSGWTRTVNWFCDDHWRFDDFSSRWAPAFNWVVTTSSAALERYRAAGIEHAIKSQWACNHFLYRPADGPPQYDVTFVGQPHGARREIVLGLRDAGIRVDAWGQGWEHGRLDQERMVEVFGRSRINLNLSASSVGGLSGLPRVRAAIGRRARRALRGVGLTPPMTGGRARALDALLASGGPDQIKGRNFEVPGCGGFLLTGRADNLDEYYAEPAELAGFDSFSELLATVRHYLRNEDERAATARAGYERTLREHTYAHRFADVFSRMGLPAETSTDERRGTVVEC
ncbi:MAG: glycosyltransferase [bacterium]|nr:glycosyltransferase [bacterium]